MTIGLQWNLSSEVGSYTNTKKKIEGEKVKFIGFYELKPEDFAKVIPKFREAIAARKTAPGKFPKIIFDNHAMSVPGNLWKGLTIYEDPTEEQLNNLVIHYHPEVTFQFVPLQAAEGIVSQFLKIKK